MLQSSSRSGYSLTELAISLTIISMLIAGYFAGEAMIKQSKLRSVINDFKTFDSAIQSFKLQYGYMPGDFPNASGVWGTSCATPSTNCNGNGDGYIATFPNDSQNEMTRLWQHLVLAKLLNLNVTGVSTSLQLTSASAPGALGGYYGVWAFNVPSAWGYTGYTTVVRQNRMDFGGLGCTPHPCEALLRGDDSYYIDNKMDDGMPGIGDVVAGGISTNCFVGTVYNTAPYNLTNTSAACALYYNVDDQH